MDAFSNVDSNNRGKRIIDGYTPEPYHMPWIGLLVKDGKARCTAFLVSKNANAKASVWVLSAKHCFNDVLFDEYEDKTINSTSYGLLFGVHDLRFSTQHVIYRTIDELFIYPDEGLKTKDIILIKLDRQIKFNSYINGLCLPDSTEEHTPYEDTPW
uniref:Peptidase S1 domain-containing protein n=1 Tax=Romanomermis culicivorax TaxID=13658 RepID=A0A915HJV3_ROMCU